MHKTKPAYTVFTMRTGLICFSLGRRALLDDFAFDHVFAASVMRWLALLTRSTRLTLSITRLTVHARADLLDAALQIFDSRLDLVSVVAFLRLAHRVDLLLDARLQARVDLV